MTNGKSNKAMVKISATEDGRELNVSIKAEHPLTLKMVQKALASAMDSLTENVVDDYLGIDDVEN